MKLIDLDKLLESLTGFIETKVELIKLDIQSELHKVIARFVIVIFIGLAIFLAVFMLSIGLSFFINRHLQSTYWGFLIVAAFYLVISLLAYARREAIYTAMIKAFENAPTKEDEE